MWFSGSSAQASACEKRELLKRLKNLGFYKVFRFWEFLGFHLGFRVYCTQTGHKITTQEVHEEHPIHPTSTFEIVTCIPVNMYADSSVIFDL